MMKQFVFTMLMVLNVTVFLFAQQTPTIPVDPKVRIGKLDNGLTYYIRHNEEPKGQANFYIAQKVGSILEEEDQRGLAHFLEHMCFNGTQKFPGNGVIKYCEKIGVKFGTDLNAYTSIDETVYNIDNVPVATTPSAVDSCLWILHDWADGLLLTAEDIDHERGVIHEEWRSRSNATMRLYDKILPEIYPDNRYGKRMPIGVMEVVDFFPYKALRDYYEKWYRPDQQGIVVVGDIDVDEVEAKIKAIFGTIAKPVNPAERYYVQVEDNKEPIVTLAKDKEQSFALTYLFCKHDAVPDSVKNTLDYLIYTYAQTMVEYMLYQRFSELIHAANPPFTSASASDDDFFLAKTKGAFSGYCVSDEKEVKTAAAALYREILRAVRNGFTASEYQRARADYMTGLENDYNERDKVKSKTYCRTYVRHFIDNEPIPGIEQGFALASKLAPMFEVNVINDLFKEWVKDDNIVLACLLPDKEGVTYPTVEEMKKMLADVAAEEIAPYEDKVSNEPLLAELPEPGKVVEASDASFGYKKLLFANGATVYYKVTDFKADQIRMNAFSAGGTSLYDEKEALNLKVAEDLMTLGGLGNFSSTDLPKVLAGKNVMLYPDINIFSEGLQGTTTPKDLETFLQLIYMYFTAQRADEEAFNSWKTRTAAGLANQELDPQTTLTDTIYKYLFSSSPRVMMLKSAEVEKIDYVRALAIAKERFADASDFSFVFTGNLDAAAALPLFEQYIGSLPSTHSKETFRTAGCVPLPGNHVSVFNKEMEIPTATIYFSKHVACDYNLKNQLLASVASQVLKILMTEEIREKEGGTYGVSVSVSVNNLPSPKAALTIYYQTDPEKYEHLNARIEEIMNHFAQNGPSAHNLDKVKEYMAKKRAENLRENNYFATLIKEQVLYGQDFSTNYEKILDEITAEEVRAFVDTLWKEQQGAKIVMVGVEKK